MQFYLKVVHSCNYLVTLLPDKLVTDFGDSKLALFDPILGGAKLSQVGLELVLMIDVHIWTSTNPLMCVLSSYMRRGSHSFS